MAARPPQAVTSITRRQVDNLAADLSEVSIGSVGLVGSPRHTWICLSRIHRCLQRFTAGAQHSAHKAKKRAATGCDANLCAPFSPRPPAGISLRTCTPQEKTLNQTSNERTNDGECAVGTGSAREGLPATDMYFLVPRRCFRSGWQISRRALSFPWAPTDRRDRAAHRLVLTHTHTHSDITPTGSK